MSKKYLVLVGRAYWHTAAIEAEANGPKAAERKALEQIDDVELKLNEMHDGSDYASVLAEVVDE